MEFHSPGSKFIMTHTLPPTTPNNGVSIIEPPFHYHIYQSEHFNVRSGIGNFYQGLDKKPFAVLSSSSDKKTASITAGRYHRFENASHEEDLVVDIQLDPEDYESEQRFFRNFFGYLDDCKKSKTTPSLFQLMVFLHSADTPLALPLLNEKLGVYISWLFTMLVAYYGRYVLGYQPSYQEYYEEKKGK